MRPQAPVSNTPQRTAGEPIIALIPAAGLGSRFGAVLPKQYALLDDRAVIDHSIERVAACRGVVRVLVGLAADDAHFDFGQPELETVVGGETRAGTVLAMLRALGEVDHSTWVLVHDAARPCVRVTDVDRLVETVVGSDCVGGILAARVRDTVKRVDESGSILETVPRDGLWCAGTPQFFRLGPLREALRSAFAAGATLTDEASAMERLGHKVAVVEGWDDNIKITQPGDLELARSILARQKQYGAGADT